MALFMLGKSALGMYDTQMLLSMEVMDGIPGKQGPSHATRSSFQTPHTKGFEAYVKWTNVVKERGVVTMGLETRYLEPVSVFVWLLLC